MGDQKRSLKPYIKLFPEEFRAACEAKLAFKSALEADERLEIPSRIWFAFLLPSDLLSTIRLPRALEHAQKLKVAMSKTIAHPKRFLKTRGPLYASNDCVTLALLEILFNLKAGQVTLPQARYREWVEVAEYFGLWKLRYCLEDALFKKFDPDNFLLFESVVDKKMFMDQHVVLAIHGILKDALKRAGLLGFDIQNRKKNIYGVYQKVALKNISVNEIFDIHGFRILTSSPKKCYQAVEILHRLWPHVPERYKDYIQKPKSNGYQSIHTVLCCLEKKLIEFQVRTREMDVIAASGPANHAEYKRAHGIKSESS